jgi:hypothetical protein
VVSSGGSISHIYNHNHQAQVEEELPLHINNKVIEEAKPREMSKD